MDQTVKKLEYAKFAKKAANSWSRSWDSSVEQLNYYSDAQWCDPQKCGRHTYCEFAGFNYERTFEQCTDAELATIQPIIHHCVNVCAVAMPTLQTKSSRFLDSS